MKKSLKIISLFTLVVVLILTVTSCKKDKKDTIRIASVGPISGDVAIYGNSTKKGIELAIEEINNNGGILVDDKQMKIEWVGMIDDEASSDKAATAFNTQYAKNIDLMLGAITSGATEGLVGQAIGKKLLVITPTGTANYITVGKNGDERDLRTNIFRVCFNDSYQGEVAAKFISNNLKKTKVAVLYNNEDSYSMGLYNSFKNLATTNQIDIVYEQSYQNNSVDFKTAWNSIKSSGAEVVFLPEYYEKVITIVSQGRDAGYNGTIVGADGWDGVLSVDGVDENDFTNCYFSNHFAVDSNEAVVNNFVNSYKSKYNENPTSFAALGYDAVYIYKKAVEEAKSIEFDKVLEVLTSSNFYADVVTGRITFAANGNAVKPAVVMTFENKNYKYYTTVE